MKIKSRLGTIEEEIEAARRYLDEHPDPNDRVARLDRVLARSEKVRTQYHALKRLHATIIDEAIDQRQAQFPEEEYSTAEARVTDALTMDASYRAREAEIDRLDKILDQLRDERNALDDLEEGEKQQAAERLKLLPFAEQMARTMRFQNENVSNPEASVYLGTVLSMRPDRHGRYYLMDIRFYTESGESQLLLSGTEKPTLLAGAYTDTNEVYTHNGEKFIRQHGLPGARIAGTGSGALVYMGSALAVDTLYAASVVGTASYSGGRGHGRSDSASALWDSFAAKKVTIRKTTKKMKVVRQTVCLPFPTNKRVGTFRVRNEETRKMMQVQGRVASTRRRLCEDDVRYDYGVPGGVVTTDYLRGDALLRTPFYVFGPCVNFEADPQWRKPTYFSSAWRKSEATGAFESYPNDGYRGDISSGAKERLRELGDGGAIPSKGYAPAITKQTTAEMLARAYHGDSPGLINYIMTALQANGWDEQAQLYHDRPDIIAAIRKHDELAFYRYGKAATPPNLSGLRGFGQTGSAIPPLPATIAQEIEAYALPDGGTE